MQKSEKWVGRYSYHKLYGLREYFTKSSLYHLYGDPLGKMLHDSPTSSFFVYHMTIEFIYVKTLNSNYHGNPQDYVAVFKRKILGGFLLVSNDAAFCYGHSNSIHGTNTGILLFSHGILRTIFTIESPLFTMFFDQISAICFSGLKINNITFCLLLFPPFLYNRLQPLAEGKF